ncbi:MAG: translation elongation factor 4 [bacterium]
MERQRRNFSIIAHIDHGKSTLADRILELTGVVTGRQARAQVLDQMDLERERGVTIKLQPVRLFYKGIELNLIDTPGHVDFSYEVSRSLAAVEGALLLVDATQGIQAQTLAHFSLARELGLTVIPVVNKIDLPNAETEGAKRELADLVGCSVNEVLAVSAKTGEGVALLLDAILARIPPPRGELRAPARALVFDAVFDDYRGVIAYIRCVDGTLTAGERMEFFGTHASSEILEVGTFSPHYEKLSQLDAGDIGYVVTGLKSLADCRVGDTLAIAGTNVEQLPGYREPQSVVFASFYPQEGEDADDLRSALEKLQLNDAALQFEGERSPTFGLGFRCGFLGLFHLEIIQERLRREYKQQPIVTVPSVAYRIVLTNGEERIIRDAQHFPDPAAIRDVGEPWTRLSCVLPPEYLGTIIQTIHENRGVVVSTEALGNRSGTGSRMLVTGEMPLASVITNLYDHLKSRTSGYASMYYDVLAFRTAEIVKLDIIIGGEPADALASLVVRDEADRAGRRILLALKDSLPKEQFEIRLQAAVGGRILASERIAPLRKDVTAKLYGGDVTRKRKLLEKQKKGKKRMRQHGRVVLPPEAYLAVLKKDSRRVQ